jgi:hypothetical protein
MSRCRDVAMSRCCDVVCDVTMCDMARKALEDEPAKFNRTTKTNDIKEKRIGPP